MPGRESAGEDVDRKQQNQGKHDSGRGHQTAGHAYRSSLACAAAPARSHAALRHSIATALTKSQNTMSETKYTMSPACSTPLADRLEVGEEA